MRSNDRLQKKSEFKCASLDLSLDRTRRFSDADPRELIRQLGVADFLPRQHKMDGSRDQIRPTRTYALDLFRLHFCRSALSFNVC